jgi:hypothetical protein
MYGHIHTYDVRNKVVAMACPCGAGYLAVLWPPPPPIMGPLCSCYAASPSTAESYAIPGNVARLPATCSLPSWGRLGPSAVGRLVSPMSGPVCCCLAVVLHSGSRKRVQLLWQKESPPPQSPCRSLPNARRRKDWSCLNGNGMLASGAIVASGNDHKQPSRHPAKLWTSQGMSVPSSRDSNVLSSLAPVPSGWRRLVRRLHNGSLTNDGSRHVLASCTRPL